MKPNHILKVSIFMTTYNHAPFIGQAIEGVMMQETDFPIKLFIGEDCSTDETRKICQKYKNEYPDKIELILREKNLGANANSPEIYERCFSYGKYTAMCEGDDYWTDSLKLQKQIDFLETNPDFAICFHQVEMKHEDKNIKSSLININQREVTDFEDLAYRNYIHTSSCVFRNNLFGNFPDWFYRLNLADWTLNLLNAQFGKIKFLNETMSVYRIHKGGVWSLKSSRFEMDSLADAAEYLQGYFHPKGERGFKTVGSFLFSELCYTEFEEGNYNKARHYCKRAMKMWKYLPVRKKITILLRYLLCFSPAIAEFYKLTLKNLRPQKNITQNS